MSSDRKPGEVDPDTHHKIVSMFHDPAKNSDTMAWVPSGSSKKLATASTFFDQRAKRNAGILRWFDAYYRVTRSEDGQGSTQMAGVAGRPVASTQPNALDTLAGAGAPSAVIHVNGAGTSGGTR